jgi:isochorismate pyruvate lyase|tara:strand:- start:1561 stop:1848 length:288 start_codon:yes stop_codon:yes gene_type:complete
VKTSIDEVREKIDRIDEEMVSLLVKRQKCIEIAALIKNDRSKVFDEGRIEDVVNKVKKLSVSLGLSLAIAEPLWRKLINLSIEHEFSEFDKKLNK